MEYMPDTAGLFSIRDKLVSLRHKFQGGVTLIVSRPALYLANIVCALTNTWGLQMKAVTADDIPDDRNTHTTV